MLTDLGRTTPCAGCLLTLAVGAGAATLDVVTRRATFVGARLRMGPYWILDTLGEGGMGIVYLAAREQRPWHRVALKVLKRDTSAPDMVAWFEFERQALVSMEHPNIVAVLDAGTIDDGRPYFVMEYVRGIPITDYCDKRELSTRARLELFTQVCTAVQHAHRKGIIHRDLKPTNVLVMERNGRALPKVIDFGLAQVIDRQRLGMRGQASARSSSGRRST